MSPRIVGFPAQLEVGAGPERPSIRKTVFFTCRRELIPLSRASFLEIPSKPISHTAQGLVRLFKDHVGCHC